MKWKPCNHQTTKGKKKNFFFFLGGLHEIRVEQFSKQWRNIHTSGDRSNGRPTTGTSTKSPGLFTFFVVVVILHRNRKGTGISTKPEKEKKKENNDKIREYPHPELIKKNCLIAKERERKKKRNWIFYSGRKSPVDMSSVNAKKKII